MCNLYSVTKGQQVIREAACAMRDTTSNLRLGCGVLASCAAIAERLRTSHWSD
jgi:hypothetical protein